MREIVEGPDGPQGWEDIEFSELGVRFAVLGDDGKLVEGDQYTPEMLGGTIPMPGDRVTTLWPRGDPDNVDLLEVVSRHYVGEFDGENCWWIIVKPAQIAKVDRALYKLARSASSRMRKLRRGARDRS